MAVLGRTGMCLPFCAMSESRRCFAGVLGAESVALHVASRYTGAGLWRVCVGAGPNRGTPRKACQANQHTSTTRSTFGNMKRVTVVVVIAEPSPVAVETCTFSIARVTGQFGSVQMGGGRGKADFETEEGPHTDTTRWVRHAGTKQKGRKGDEHRAR